MKKLTKVEEQIMHIIWELERCTVTDIISSLSKNDIPHSTISSVVRILEKKDFVDHKSYGRTYEYFPLISKRAYSKKKLHSFVADYFENSMDSLVSHIINEKDISIEELNKLIKKIKKNKK